MRVVVLEAHDVTVPHHLDALCQLGTTSDVGPVSLLAVTLLPGPAMDRYSARAPGTHLLNTCWEG